MDARPVADGGRHGNRGDVDEARHDAGQGPFHPRDDHDHLRPAQEIPLVEDPVHARHPDVVEAGPFSAPQPPPDARPPPHPGVPGPRGHPPDGGAPPPFRGAPPPWPTGALPPLELPKERLPPPPFHGPPRIFPPFSSSGTELRVPPLLISAGIRFPPPSTPRARFPIPPPSPPATTIKPDS